MNHPLPLQGQPPTPVQVPPPLLAGGMTTGSPMPHNLGRIAPSAGAGAARMSGLPAGGVVTRAGRMGGPIHAGPMRWGGRRGGRWFGGFSGPKHLPGGLRTWYEYGIWPYRWATPYWGIGYPAYVPVSTTQQPATPSEVYGARQLTETQARDYCNRIYWPFCEDGDNAASSYCRTFASYCMQATAGG